MNTDWANRPSYAQHEQARVGPSVQPAGALASRIANLQAGVGTLVSHRQRLEALCDRLGVKYEQPPSAPQPTASVQSSVPRELPLLERVDYQLDRLADELARINRCNDALDGAL